MAENNKQSKKISRRKFLVRGGLGTLGLLALGTVVFRNPMRRAALEMSEDTLFPYAGTGTEPNLWFEVTRDNQVMLHSPKVEMGQGVFTGLAQIMADELDVDINQVVVTAAETQTGIVDGMSTGGSLSIATLWMPLREMAATMREMIKSQAAAKMGVGVEGLSTANGVVSGGGKSMTYAEAVAEVTEWEVPETPPLRQVKEYKFVGKPIKRVDLRAKVVGEPIFGLDAEMPDMLHATIIRPQHIGATLKSADIQEAEQMPGVVKVMHQANWVGIIAESFAQALAAKRKVKVDMGYP
jgi:isoquinoline 1-oxidoreductase beta subunit